MPDVSTESDFKEHDRQRVIVTSIGESSPQAVASLAKGFGTAPERIVAALYRAPSILVDKVDRKIGERLTELLRDIGLEVRLESDDLPPPEPAVLHDIALYIPDAADVPRVTEALTAFLGCGPEKALELLVSPPGLIVGEVSAATGM